MNALLDHTCSQLLNTDEVGTPVASLVGALHSHRKAIGAVEWRAWVESDLRRHDLYPLVLEDPFIRHAAVRPRGYPGDAELLDYIYGSGNVRPMIESATPLGRRLYEYDRDTPSPAAVRNRSRMAAREVDRIAAAGQTPDVLSIACGHLREAQSLESLRNGTLGRFVATDQDPLSLELVRREWGHLGVDARQCDAKMLMRRGLATLGKFDFIYCLGLYDYLSDPAAARLTGTAVDMLKPGGKVWIANFLPDVWSVSYMEAMMDWWLIYRSEDHLSSLSDGIEAAKIASRRIFLEPEKNVAFLEIVRA